MSTPTATPSSGGTGGGTPAEVQSVPGWAWMIIIAIFLTAMVILVKGCKSKGGSGTGQTNSPSPQAVTVKTVEALVLRFDERTPCSTTIAWPFRIERYGQSLTVKYPGIVQPITYHGEVDTNATSRVDEGEFFFNSPDQNHPHVRVKVYEKVKIKQQESRP
jgi:hypothetical protein